MFFRELFCNKFGQDGSGLTTKKHDLTPMRSGKACLDEREWLSKAGKRLTGTQGPPDIQREGQEQTAR